MSFAELIEIVFLNLTNLFSKTNLIFICSMIFIIFDLNSSFFFNLIRNKEAEEKCKMDIIDVDVENFSNENHVLLQLAKRNSRLTTKYQTYLRIKHSREERKSSKFLEFSSKLDFFLNFQIFLIDFFLNRKLSSSKEMSK